MIYTNLIKLPFSVKEFVHETENGDHVIFINECLSIEEQQESFNHAIKHITNHDFKSDLNADTIEMKRH